MMTTATTIASQQSRSTTTNKHIHMATGYTTASLISIMQDEKTWHAWYRVYVWSWHGCCFLHTRYIQLIAILMLNKAD